MKKFLIPFLFICTAFTLNAQSKAKAPKINKRQVVIVGRVTVRVADDDFKFYAQTWGVTDFSQPDTYILYEDSYKSGAFVLAGQVVKTDNGQFRQFNNGEVFYSVRNLTTDRSFVSKSAVKWSFFGSDSFQIWIPFAFQAQVPENVEYIYLGDFEYIVEGSDFHVAGVMLKDNYDAAKKELEEKLGKEINLCRVEVELVENKSKKKKK